MRPALALTLLLTLSGAALGQPAADPGGPAPSAPGRPGRAPPRTPQTPGQPIMVYDARIEAGDLRVSGSVRKPGAIVVLDDDISIQADRRGRFVFRVPYRPATCVVTRGGGGELRPGRAARPPRTAGRRRPARRDGRQG
jgi:hypothetical protein